MRLKKKVCFILFCAVICTQNVFARTREGADPFLLPQVGAWFGPVTPVYYSWGLVDPAIALGTYARYNLPHLPLKASAEVSYGKMKSKGMNELVLIPVYGSLLYKLPINSILSYQIKIGAGGAHVKVKPARLGQWDPLFMVGTEFSFPAGTVANVGLRIDYMLVYEKYIQGAKHNGHFLNVGVNCNFNIGLFE